MADLGPEGPNALKRVEPVPDDITGVNLPYRGNVDHGVPSTEPEMTDEAHYWQGRPVEYAEDEKEPDPIPVRIVNREARENKAWHVSNPFVNDTVQAIAGRDSHRNSLKIVNNSPTETVWIGPTGTISSYAGGYPLGPGKDISLVTTEPVYAVSTATGANVATLSEVSEAYK